MGSATPWLVFFSHGKRKRSHTFFSMSEGRSYVRSVQEMNRKTCVLCSHGWLLMVAEGNPNENCSLINLVSMETIQILPLPVLYKDTYACLLSSPPSDQNYFFICAYRDKPMFIYWHGLKQEWGKIEYKIGEDELDEDIIQQLVSCNGKIYGTTDNTKFVVIDFEASPIVRLMEAGIPDISLVAYSRLGNVIKLVESCGEIFALYIMRLGSVKKLDIFINIEVYRMDFLSMAWINIHNIGDRAFFLCPFHTHSCSAIEAGVKGNSIYYVLHEDKTIYRFDVTTKRTTWEMPYSNTSAPSYKPHWVLPSS